MFYPVCLTVIGALLMLCGAGIQGWGYGLCWFGFSFLWLGIAHFGGEHRAFGKRADGTLPLWSKLLHLPFLFYTALIWRALYLCSREPTCDRVTDQLVIGRRLLPAELAEEFANYVDLTAEFEEPHAIRRLPGYYSHPILDASAPSPDVLRDAIAQLRPGRTYVHCAQGHGRTGLFALALLLSNGTAQGVEDGLRLLVGARPAVHLNARQRKCIESYAKQLKDVLK